MDKSVKFNSSSSPLKKTLETYRMLRHFFFRMDGNPVESDVDFLIVLSHCN